MMCLSDIGMDTVMLAMLLKEVQNISQDRYDMSHLQHCELLFEDWMPRE